MDIIRLYVANSCDSPLEEGRFYVFEDHIVYKADSDTFAIPHVELTEDTEYLNAVDGFRQYCEIVGMSTKYCFIGELGAEALREIRRQLRVLLRNKKNKES